MKGDFEHVRFDDTFGLAMTSIVWHVAREFAFAENTVSLGRMFSVYNSVQIDKARAAIGGASYGSGLTQSFSLGSYRCCSSAHSQLTDLTTTQ